MNTSILKALAAAAIGVGLFISPAAAREHRHVADFWWDKAGYSGSNVYEDEYSYPGIRWYDDCRGPWRERYRHHGRRHHHHHGEWRYDRDRNEWR